MREAADPVPACRPLEASSRPGRTGSRRFAMRSDYALQEILDAVAVAATGCQPRSVDEDDRVVALEERLELLDTVLANDDRPVDAQEAVGIETSLEVGHRFAHEVLFGADVNANVVGRGLDPIHIVDAQNKD